MEKEKQKELLLNLICTSKVESSFVNGSPTYQEAALIYINLDDDIENLKHQYLAEYDGFGKKHIEQIEADQNRLTKIIKKNLNELDAYKPKVVNPTYGELELSEISSRKLQKFCISFNRTTAKSNSETVRFIKCNLEIVRQLRTPLYKLGKSLTKKNIIDTVLEEIELDGQFTLKQEFESIPDACQFYEKELKTALTREKLKAQIKNFAVFYENGEELEWGLINKRINSWVDHENSKPNKQNIPHK